MPEGLSATEVGKEIGEHSRHQGGHEFGDRHQRLISISEALLLSIVAILAAWSGYSAAKWSTESSLKLAKASATRTKANRAFQLATTTRSQDAANFNAWFSAYLAGNRTPSGLRRHRAARARANRGRFSLKRPRGESVTRTATSRSPGRSSRRPANGPRRDSSTSPRPAP